MSVSWFSSSWTLSHTLKKGTHTVTCLFWWRDNSPGPSWRLRAQLLLTRWFSASCLATKGHFYIIIMIFFCLELCAGSPPTPSSPSVAIVLLQSVLWSTAVPVLPPSLPCDVFLNKKRRKKTGKDITICQPAGILYIISQEKKESTWKLYYTKPDGRDLQIL